MPANPHRGEIEARLDGAPFRLCLTLGALAELESAFGDTDMLALAERFQAGRLSARDAQRIIGAGLRGAGHDIADDTVARMQADGGAAGYVDIVARLLAATFGGGVKSTPADPPSPLRGGAGDGGNSRTASAEGRSTPAPFPGPT
jgi:tail tube GTA-gp10-like protein